jgi:P27 family predicted phage terminase small subunit
MPKGSPAIKYAEGLPPAPAWLSEDAAIIYEDIRRQMQEAGIAQTPDAAIVAMVANAQAEYQRISNELRGNEVIERRGLMFANPLLKALQVHQRALQAGLQKLGFTPVDRARVSRSNAPKADNPVAEFAG